MTLNIEKEYDLELGLDYEETARLVIDQVLDEEECPYEAEVNLLLTSDEEIHRINLEYRGIDRPTDVLPRTRSCPPGKPAQRSSWPGSRRPWRPCHS